MCVECVAAVTAVVSLVSKDHRIRNAVSLLKGAAREKAILWLMQHPSMIAKANDRRWKRNIAKAKL